MSVLLFAELSDGIIKKSVLEASTYGYDLAQKLGVNFAAVTVGPVDPSELEKLAQHGVSQIYTVGSDNAEAFVNAGYAVAVAEVAEHIGAKAVVMAQTYNGKAIAPRIAVKLEAAILNGVITMVDPSQSYSGTRMSYSGKGVQSFQAVKDRVIVLPMANSYGVKENPVQSNTEVFTSSSSIDAIDAIATELLKVSEGVSLTEAEAVVSAGRGMKGPENWPMIDELAQLLGAATACSKPVADMEWRPHHEHVGQTGIQISPALYIAIGISGAIQHLAGVSSSKTIVVINKDPEAPFFKIADIGIVGDLFDVVPKLIEGIKSAKATV
ncbi:MAG: electron transfer flavoprotein subunit alpha/FixB family protein [Bacteroidota bacterium]